jgi:tetratricopeptide (TPR) repeat protein/AraC-like DNA-binding protein
MSELFSPDQVFIKKLTEIIIANLGNENFGVKELIRESGMSRIGLSRRINSITNKTINQFIRETRLQKALELLQNEAVTASEVAYKVGFTSPAYFNTCFHEFFGYPPGKVKKKGLESPEENILSQVTEKLEQSKHTWKTLIFTSFVFIIILIAIVVFIVYPKISKRDTLESLISSDGRISIAVMPFQNMTNDTAWNIRRIWIQDILITYLTNFTEDLRVKQIESINNLIQNKSLTDYASITIPVASTISQKLDADVFIFGSIKQAGNTIRLNAQLIGSKTEEAFKSFEIDGPAIGEMIFHLVDSLKLMVTNYLILSKLNEENPYYQKYVTTRSPEAYRYYLYGQNAFAKLDYPSAIDLFSTVISIDSNFFDAAEQIAWAYGNQGMYEQAKKWCLRNYKKKDLMPLQQMTSTNWTYARFFETPFEEIKYLKQLREIDDQSPDTYYLLGGIYNRLYMYNKAIPELEKSLEIYNKWGPKPWWVADYTILGLAYHKTGQHKKEKKLYKKAEQDFPDDPSLLYRQAILTLTEGDTGEADEYLRKYISVRKETGASEAAINTSLASVYSEAGVLDKADEYYRQALSLEPENALRLRNLAYFLINRDRDIEGGLALADKALELNPDNYSYLDCKGWGLFKQGRYNEALELLGKSWNLKPVYNHNIYLHIEDVKKAIAGSK